MTETIAAIEQDFAAGRIARLAQLEVQAQDDAAAAAEALARGHHEQGVLLLVSALIATEEIDTIQGAPA